MSVNISHLPGKLLLAILLLVCVTPVMAQRDVIDKIIVVVDDQIILASELASQIQLYTFQTGQQPKTQAEFEKLQDDILEQMVNDQLFLAEAKKDTAIKLRDEEIDMALDDHLARLAQNFNSDEEFQAALQAEGLTIRDLRKKYRDDVRNQLLRQRFIQRKLMDVSISRHEVEEFYDEFKDSIPAQPEAARLAHILLTITPSPEVEDSVREVITELRQRILDGADFAAIAAQYSTGGAGANGGDLGFVSKGDVVPEFGRAAFNLAVGDVSGVIRTQFGFHIIKNEGKRGDQLHLRHVLLNVTPTAADSARTIALADSLLQAAQAGADFAEMAKIYSQDNDTRASGGELGWFAVNKLPPEFAEFVVGWKTPGEYRGPVFTQYGVHILKLLEYQPEHRFDLATDYDKIKELARQNKTGILVDDWIKDIKKHSYIEYRLDNDKS